MPPKSKKGAKKGAEAAVPDKSGDGGEHSDSARHATGTLISEKRARDVKIDSFSLSLHGKILVEDTVLELNHGARYGVIGRNGCGKSSILACIANREIPIPSHFDLYLLAHEAPPSELTALEYVILSAQEEMERIDRLIDEILVTEGPEAEQLQILYERQDELDPQTFESRASTILVGLGFKHKASDGEGGSTIQKKTKDMSGGWRMRVALARALFLQPAILCLDEPTAHLDLGACVWMEDYLATYPKILVIVSHSQDFLNGVCTEIMEMSQRKLRYWKGNYDQYIATKSEQDTNQLKMHKKQQEEIQHIKEFIASCGTFANLVKQAQSRQKILDKMEADGLIQLPFSEPVFRFRFPDAGELCPPLVSFSDVAFSYSGEKKDYLFSKVSCGIHPNSRVSFVGPNGAGKSTLIKLICGEINATEGSITRRPGMSIGRFHQHSAEVLELDKSPVEYISAKYQDRYPSHRLQEWRGVVGQYGIPSEHHLTPIATLSPGLRTRLVFCDIAMRQPHLLLFDEPTNGADMEMIDSMAEAIRAFNGGVIVISHDFRLLSKVSDEIWVIDHGIQVRLFLCRIVLRSSFGCRYGMGISRAIRRVSGRQAGRP